MKILFSILFLFLSVSINAQRSISVTDKELKELVGKWTGTMVYTNDNDAKSQVTLLTTLEIVDLKDSLGFNFTYTEPGGNQVTEKNSMRIYEDGNKLSFDSAQFDIVETRRRGVRITIIAEREGVDKSRSADFQEIIIMGSANLNITKGIRYMDMTEYYISKRLALTKIK
jgi:hypothetical protein